MAGTQEAGECCPRFDPTPWDEHETVWKDKLFVKESVPQFLHMPLPWTFGRAVTRAWQKIEAAGARPADKDMLMLSGETSPWKGQLYINATKEVPDAENVKLSGTYLTRVFDGPYNAAPKWIKAMDAYVARQGKQVRQYYFYYTTCPKCARKYGHNYVVVFAQV